MGTLVDTEEIMKALSVQLRMAEYTAMDASNHLAVHSTRNYAAIMHDVSVRISELAEIARDIGEVHTKDRRHE